MREYWRKIRNRRRNYGVLRWCPCVGHRLNHVNCRIYTNCRWGVKVKVHVQTFSQRDLRVPEPWMALESTAEGLKHYFGSEADRVVRRNWRTLGRQYQW